MRKALPAVLLALAVISLAACGEVVTPQPTTETPPTVTPTTASSPTPRPTATAPLLPPADTATPTITPTPITHVVQEGDTLQAIAFDYGVSLAALQAANGIENPQLLQVGQELIIPVSEERGETSPGLLLPTPTPQPLEVRGVALYETPVGSLECLGEVVNTTAITLTNVQLRVALFDQGGEQLVAANVDAAAELLPPGMRSPFRMLFTSPPPDWTNYQATVIRGNDAGALADSYVPIAVTEVDGKPAESQFQVDGTVQNASSDQAAERVEVIVTTYDAQGLVTGFRERILEVEDALASGATAPFSVLLTCYGDVPEDFNVTVLGRAPAE